MNQFLSLIVFGLGASAGILKRRGPSNLGGRHSQNCFQLQAKGPANGIVGQIPDGQARIGGGYRSAPFCMDSAGVIKDSNGHGCIITSETGQFQCDYGVPGMPGFSCGPDNTLSYNGHPEFWACPVTDFGEWNMYTRPIANQLKCVPITLMIMGSGQGGEHPSGPQLLHNITSIPSPHNQTLAPPSHEAPSAQPSLKPPQISEPHDIPPTFPSHDAPQRPSNESSWDIPPQRLPPLSPPNEHPQNPPFNPPTECDKYRECHKAPDCELPAHIPQNCGQDLFPHLPKHHGHSYGCQFYEDCYNSPKCHLPIDVPRSCWKPHYLEHIRHAVSDKLDCGFYRDCFKSKDCLFPSRVPESCWESHFSKFAHKYAPSFTDQHDCGRFKKCHELGKCESSDIPSPCQHLHHQDTVPNSAFRPDDAQPATSINGLQPLRGYMSANCPMSINGGFQYPQMIQKIDALNPQKPSGPASNGEICQSISTLYTFEVPDDYAGHVCELVFLVPWERHPRDNLKFNGKGRLSFAELKDAASPDTTYANAPARLFDFGSYDVRTKSNYLVGSYKCPAGTSVTFEVSGQDGLCMSYDHDKDVGLAGLFLNAC